MRDDLSPPTRGSHFFCIPVKSPTDLSPPARGRRAGGFLIITSKRFIPSCEGQTSIYIYWLNAGRFIPSCERQIHLMPMPESIHKVHPLLRGADAASTLYFFINCDSSPLARGRPTGVDSAGVYRRFIPSYEGQTSVSRADRVATSIHPLLRGTDNQ